MFGINVTEYDKFIYEEYLRDFLPDRMIDIHVHIWKEGMERAGDESKNRKGMTGQSLSRPTARSRIS